MVPSKAECYPGGEFEVEMASSHELEIRHKDLLPIFDNFPRARSGWIDRLILLDLFFGCISTICGCCIHHF